MEPSTTGKSLNEADPTNIYITHSNMSKLSDYSKFDHLVIDDDDDDNDHKETATPLSLTTTTPTTPELRHVRKPSANNNHHWRFLAQYQGHTVYEWEQSLNEVLIYIVSPLNNNTNNNNNTDAKIVCQISATHLKVGIQSPKSDDYYYIDEDTYHPIDTKESTWCLEEEEEEEETHQHAPPKIITIYLQKMAKGLVWDAPLRGHVTTTTATLDPLDRQDVQQALLLERWQEENPGMDFRDASFSQSHDNLPDPRTYMGGIGYP